MYADDLQQRSRIFELINNVSNSSIVSLDWQSTTGSYAVVSYNYKQRMSEGRTYLFRCKVKYTGNARAWMQMYSQNGYQGSGASVSNPLANTEYTISNVYTIPSIQTGASGSIVNTHGTLYSGVSSTVGGSTNYWKELQIIDLTELLPFIDLKRGATSRTAWVNANIPFFEDKAFFMVNADGTFSTSASPALNTLPNTINFQGGIVTADDFVEADALPELFGYNGNFKDAYFDSGYNSLSVYNNSGGGTVTHTRIAALPDTPFPHHSYNIRITTNGTASPGAGGFITSWLSYAGAIFCQRFVAKIPVGYSVETATNAQGTGYTTKWLTSKSGTGDWKEYALIRYCGLSGSFSSGGHIYVSGPNNTSVTWYLAYCTALNVTSVEKVAYCPILEANVRMKDNVLYTSTEFNTKNLLTNGDARYKLKGMSGTGWTLDYADKRGRAVASFVQPVGVSSQYLSDYIPVDLGKKYKIHAWVKRYTGGNCLAALCFYTSNYTNIDHPQFFYKSGTKTTLAANLVNGATTVTLTSAANWALMAYTHQQRVGFRSSVVKSYNDLGTAPYFTAINGNVLTLSSAWTGGTINAGAYVVQSADGNTWWYPLNLTAGTWVETNTTFYGSQDGSASTSWSTSAMFPYDTKYMRLLLNIYSNNSTASEPLKLSDLSIEVVNDDYIQDGRDHGAVTIL